MLAAIKHIVNENVVLHQDSAPQHCVHNTVQPLQCTFPFSCSMVSNSPELNPFDDKI